MKTLDQMIDDVFVKEGDRYAEPPAIDQPTGRGGITLAAYQRFADAMQQGRRVTTLDLQGLSHKDARGIIQWLLEQLSQEMGLSDITFEPLRLQLLDFGYNSGGSRAIRWLQRVLNVPPTGKLDRGTVFLVEEKSGWLIHHALIAARLQMIDSFTDASNQKKWEEGLENRALSFSLLQV